MKFEAVNKWLSAIASVAVLIGVPVAIWQLSVALSGFKQSREIASATFVLQLRDQLEKQDSPYNRILTEIEDHDQNYPLRSAGEGNRKGKFRDAQLERYVGFLEGIGDLLKDDVILSDMAYDAFSYDVEKAWCNKDIQRVIGAARQADKSATKDTDPYYGNFENLAHQYLGKEKQSCEDLDKQ